jgi:signal transduction histidine kinase
MSPPCRFLHEAHQGIEMIDTLSFETGDGLAGLVHDLGNYIQIATSAVHIMSRHADVVGSEGLGTIVSHAAASLERAGALIRRNADDDAADSVAIEDCLTQMGPLLHYALGPDIRIKLLVGIVPKVQCSSLGLQNALLNLALNARDAMPGGGTLTVSAMTADGPEAAEVEIAMRDTGIGMAREVLERALEPYFTTKAGPAGHGMGLPGVRSFVEQFGGRVLIDSAPYTGTTVTLRLPAAI